MAFLISFRSCSLFCTIHSGGTAFSTCSSNISSARLRCSSTRSTLFKAAVTKSHVVRTSDICISARGHSAHESSMYCQTTFELSRQPLNRCHRHPASCKKFHSRSSSKMPRHSFNNDVTSIIHFDFHERDQLLSVTDHVFFLHDFSRVTYFVRSKGNLYPSLLPVSAPSTSRVVVPPASSQHERGTLTAPHAGSDKVQLSMRPWLLGRSFVLADAN